MEQLRPVELKLVDELFGMSAGHVLDFTISTLANFFRRKVGIDIYDDAYAIYGGSKGKRLLQASGCPKKSRSNRISSEGQDHP
jgi:hypothetical protein